MARNQLTDHIGVKMPEGTKEIFAKAGMREGGRDYTDFVRKALMVRLAKKHPDLFEEYKAATDLYTAVEQFE